MFVLVDRLYSVEEFDHCSRNNGLNFNLNLLLSPGTYILYLGTYIRTYIHILYILFRSNDYKEYLWI
jgi:hypothetical protein